MSVIYDNYEENQLYLKNDLGQLSIHQDIPFLFDYGIKASPIYDTYWRFACERQNIFTLRNKGVPYPWTNDEILLKNKFTNAYRASDRVSQYLIRNVIYPAGNEKAFTPEDIFFRVILFKTFNKIDTWEYLQNNLERIDYISYSFEKYNKLLEKRIEEGEKLYSAAYIMPSGTMFGFQRKHSNNLRLIELMMSQKTVKKIAHVSSLKELYELLFGFPSLGRFLAFQYAVDINYTELCDFNEMDYVVAGPGAQSGIAKLFSDTNGHTDEFIIRLMAENQEEEFQRLNLDFKYLGTRKLQLIDCQNLFCETDKYTRVAFPNYQGNQRTRIKQRFYPNLNNPIDYFYPPKWGINIK